MEDREIIGLFFDRNEEALTEVKKKYAHLYQRLIGRTLINPSDAEECEQDLLLALWKSIPPKDPDCLPAYILALARRLSASGLRRSLREKRADSHTVLLSELEDCLPDANTPESEIEAKEIREALNDFLSELDVRSRVIFLRRFYFREEVKEIAARFGMRENAVSSLLARTRKKLKRFLEKRGIAL